MASGYLQPIGSQNLKYREAAYTAIKAAILAGELPFDQPLIEERLAALLQISRTPVREALAILEHEALLAPGEGRGLYSHAVAPPIFEALMTAGEVLATHLARRATQWITEESLRLLEETLNRNRYYATAGDVPRFLQTAREFWRQIGDAAENPPLRDFLITTLERTDLYMLMHRQAISATVMQSSNQEYAAILDALIKRDPDETARLVSYHMQSLRARLPDLFVTPETTSPWDGDLREFC